MPPSLNPAQAEAVATLTGPLLVLAGAGTGKTRVVTYRIAELIRRRVPPERILAVTFTNKAAAEMQQRCGALLRKKLESRPEISTFHSLCVRVLRRHITKLGYPERFSIYDSGDQEGLARESLRELRVPSESLRPRDLLAIISRWKAAGVRPKGAIESAVDDRDHVAAVAYRRYQGKLKGAGAVDFDDLLLLTEELFRRHAAARKQEASRFDHILIDEYQDTNGSQYRIIRALAAGHRNLCVVGDDDQSIYGWRGAEVAHILRFARDWPNAKVVRLEENYRSTAAILETANRLIAFNRKRHPKVLRAARHGGERPRILQFKDEQFEASATIADIRRKISAPGVEPRDVAILFRTGEQPRAFEEELRRASLPYVLIGGQSFFDRREIRDVLAYLKLLGDPRDETALLRIINRPPRGIGQVTVRRLTDRAVERGVSLWDVLDTVRDDGDIPQSAAEAVQRFQKLIRNFSERKAPLSATATELLQAIEFRQDLVQNARDPHEEESRWNGVEEVINGLARYEQKAGQNASWRGFVEELILGEQLTSSDKEAQLEQNAVALMTLHAAKGLEFPHVYMVGLEEGLLPHRRSMENETAVDEERRLCYVGITRAQETLTLSLSLQRMKWGKPRESLPSRFLYELMGESNSAAAR